MTTTPRPSVRPRRLMALLLLLVLVLGACSSDDRASSTDDSAAGSLEEEVQEAAFEDAEFEGAATETAAEPVGLADGEQAADEEAPSAQGPVPTSSTAATGERIIKEGTVTVEVDPGEFDGAFAFLVARAQALGGHVSGSSSSTDDEGLVQGTVTIRVPVRSFEDLLTVLGEAGTVVDRSVTSQDVTAEFTDLESRRRHLQAQEAFYLGLLAEAQGVSDAIAVQQQLESIQGQIEQISGRLNLLEDRSSFSTLTVRVRERGADAVAAEVPQDGFGQYLVTARETLVATLGAMLVVATFALPFLVLAGIGALVWRAVRRRRDGATATAPTSPSPASAPASTLATVGAPSDEEA